MPTTTIEDLADQVRIAKRDVERAKMLYANKAGTYDDMAAAAKHLSNLLYSYETVRFPTRKARRRPYQAILR